MLALVGAVDDGLAHGLLCEGYEIGRGKVQHAGQAPDLDGRASGIGGHGGAAAAASPGIVEHGTKRGDPGRGQASNAERGDGVREVAGAQSRVEGFPQGREGGVHG